jgi:hypothetical protein
VPAEPAGPIQRGDGLTGLDELDAGHGGVVPVPRPELEDPGIATRPVSVTRRDLDEKLVGHIFVPDEGDDLTLVLDAPLLRLGNAFLEHGPQRLGLGLGGDEAFTGDQGSHEVAHHGLLVGGVAPKTAAFLRTTRNRSHLASPLLGLHTAQRQAALVEFLKDLVQRLLAEVGNREQIVLGLRHELADRVDLGPLQAVARPLGKV